MDQWMLSVIGHFVPRQKMSLHPRTKGTWALLDNKPTLLIMRSFPSKNKASSRNLKGRKHANTQKIHKKKKKKTIPSRSCTEWSPPCEASPTFSTNPCSSPEYPKRGRVAVGGGHRANIYLIIYNYICVYTDIYILHITIFDYIYMKYKHARRSKGRKLLWVLTLFSVKI